MEMRKMLEGCVLLEFSRLSGGEMNKKLEGYILLDFSRSSGCELNKAMSTMGAIQVFTSLSSAKEMAELCSGKGSSWTPVKITLERNE